MNIYSLTSATAPQSMFSSAFHEYSQISITIAPHSMYSSACHEYLQLSISINVIFSEVKMVRTTSKSTRAFCSRKDMIVIMLQEVAMEI